MIVLPFLLAVALARSGVAYASPANTVDTTINADEHVKVLILGGGVSGVIAARTLHDLGVDDFKIVEARDELGGRLKSFTFGADGNQHTVELGANWVQGTEDIADGGSENPIWSLVKKHGVKTQFNDWTGSVTTFDDSGPVDFLDIFDASGDDFTDLTVAAGDRVQRRLVDLSSRSGYSLVGAKPKTKQEMASEYYQLDWESGNSPEQSSWIAAAWGFNYTYLPEFGGFGDMNEMSIDKRGFKTFIQAEADDFLEPAQLSLNSTVKKISYSAKRTNVTLVNGNRFSADQVLVTFSLGVLQNDDVVFEPPLPDWKQEAIQGLTMATYTKIFFQFPSVFWFSTEMGLYADPERGRYPVWQSLDHVGFLPGSRILFVTVTGDFAERVEALSDAQVQSEVMGVLRSMFPNVTVPEPTAFYFPRWHSDPLYKGSYSNWPPSFFNGHHQNLQATVDQSLWFAGEHTSLRYFGFLHGAYFSGVDVGTALAECVNGPSCVRFTHTAEVQNPSAYQI